MKILDIYGEPVEILLNKNYFIKTSIGGIFTIITIILVIVFTWFIGRDIIYKEKPISYMQSDIYKKFLQTNITSNNFPFSFTMMDEFSTPLLDFSYLTINLYELTYELNLQSGVLELTKKKNHPLKFCNYSDFKTITKEQFSDAQLGYTLCPVKNDFNLYGYWNEANLNFLQISIESCKNNSDSQMICKSQDEIVKYIADTSVNMNIFYVDYRVVINNNTHPIESLTTLKYKYVIPDFYKKVTYKIQTQNILTDNGFIFSDSQNLNFFKMVEEFGDLSKTDTFKNQFLAFEIYSSNISDSYYRRYIKVPDIIASLGGILKVFTVIFLFINSIFSKVEKNISIVNEVFILNKKSENSSIAYHPNIQIDKSVNSINVSEKFFLKSNDKSNIGKPENIRDKIHHLKQEKLKGSSIIKSPITSIKKDNLLDKSNIGKPIILSIKKNLKENLPKTIYEDNKLRMKKYIKLRKSHTKIKFSFKDVFCIICNNYCKKKIPKSISENFNFYQKAKNSVEHYFDFIFMIKKFEEINIVKNCIFTPEQSKMVEIMSKPIISSKEFLKTNKSEKKIKEDFEIKVDANLFLEKIENNLINQNIMKMIEENIKKSFI